MFKPETKSQLMTALAKQQFKVLMFEEGTAASIVEQLKKLNKKSVTVIVIAQ